jgi:phosphoglucosamine mutase
LKLFGTDGVRGKANTELSPELAVALGRAAVAVLAEENPRPLIIIGRDTRVSGHMLAGALAAGLMSAGAEVWDVGVLPTPALAFLTQKTSAIAGAVISASHNPAIDNGIKFFSREGFKLDDHLEERIEQIVRDPALMRLPAGDEVGSLHHKESLQEAYLAHMVKVAGFSANGLKVVLDCANGAAYQLAPAVFRRLGCEVDVIHNAPNGTNINVSSGSTHPKALQDRVVEVRADVGFALDGDADRLIACDSDGNTVDGDSLLAICGLYLKREGRLANNTLVGTVMSNMGLDALLRGHGISLIRSQVGDKHVLKEMMEHGATLGAEQSGHCIFMEYSTTGDGILSAIMLLKVMATEGQGLNQLASPLKRYPQLLHNVTVTNRESALAEPRVKEAIRETEVLLGSRGRLVVRASGTENVVRVMVEAEDEVLAEQAVNMVVAALK